MWKALKAKNNMKEKDYMVQKTRLLKKVNNRYSLQKYCIR